MASTGTIGLLLAIITVLITFSAFRRPSVFERYAFTVDGVLVHREYSRLISAGFVHVDWWHLFFNMYALLSFAGTVEWVIGPWKVLILYLASLLGGNLLALYIHRNDSAYRAVGASGAVAGLIFATIVLYPGLSISPLFLPFHLPAWAFGLLYTLFSIYALKSRNDNIGHDAHLGGALVGILTICLLDTDVVRVNWPFVLLLTAPTIVFLFFIVKRPDWLYIRGFSFSRGEPESKDERYNRRKFQQQQEIDRILDKINEQGMNSLTNREREILNGH